MLEAEFSPWEWSLLIGVSLPVLLASPDVASLAPDFLFRLFFQKTEEKRLFPFAIIKRPIDTSLPPPGARCSPKWPG